MRKFTLCICIVGAVVTGSAPALGQWIEPPGTGWAHLQVSHHETEMRFDEDGETVPYFTANARSVTTTVRLSGVLGLVRGLDVWADVPYHRLEFNDAIQNRRSTGLGDPRLYIRAGPSIAGVDDLPITIALRAGSKFPVGTFNVDAEVIPLSEGQRDWELLLELGKSLHPWPAYVMAWFGYRWRTTNETTGLKPGNERFFYAAAGGDIRPFTWKLSVDGYFGRPTQFSGLVLGEERRALVQLIPTVGMQVGPGALEAGARVPVHGRSVPAGVTFTLGYFLTWENAFW